MQEDTKKIIAAFDFDGTISYRDTLTSFLFFTSGYLRSTLYLTIELPYLLGFLIGWIPRQTAKERILSRFFKGKSINEMQSFGEAFAKESLPKHIRPEALKRIRWHQNQGHSCFLISASIDTYLVPWATSVGFQSVLSSTLETNAEGKITGKLSGLNCWGPEKVRRLEELIGSRTSKTIYAYGDSRGDKELLDYSDHAFYQTME
ncbi:MAG: HAD family hydrolase [Chlamydiota bacterium]|nr:HAD family hydrolase [Chlamydiota bacterium]